MFVLFLWSFKIVPRHISFGISCKAVEGLDFVQLSEESDTLLVFAPTISEFVITMMKLKTVLMTRDLDDYVSIGQF